MSAARDRQSSARPAETQGRGLFGGGGPGGGGHMRTLGKPIEKAKDVPGTLKRLTGYLRPYRWQLILLLAFTVLGKLLDTLAPMVLGLAITRLFAETKALIGHLPGAHIDHTYLLQILGVLTGLAVAYAVITYIVQRALAVIAQKTVYRLRKDIDEKLSRLPLSYFDGRTHGEIMSRATNDVDNVNNTLQQGLPQLISSVVGILGAVIMMLVISPLLTLITAVTLPMAFLATWAIAKFSQKYFISQQKALGELNGHVEEMLTGHGVVKAFSYEPQAIRRFEAINQQLYQAGWKAQFISGFIFPLMNFISNLGYVAVCVAGGISVARQTLTLGNVQAFIQYIRMFTQPVAQSAAMINLLQSALASSERIFQILDETEEAPDAPGEPEATKGRGGVDFSQVSFGYKPGTPLFENLNLEVLPGHTVAIVGPTGAGKTTLVNLLMRFYEVWGGTISVNGRSLLDQPRGRLRRRFGMVLQDTWLFKGTLHDNIAYGRTGATDTEIVAAAQAAHADHFIRALPEGYQTVLNEDASNLSAGEKQLITLARALLADPEILILDEATSNVDTRTELLIQKAMKTLMQGRTSFVIAHRLSTIRDAELILVMNHGKIVETGTHKDLLEKKGFYAELYQAQFSGQTAAE
jgi:ATP-binding cassette subfamily B protein